MGAYGLFDRIAAKRNAGGAELFMEPDIKLGLRSQDVIIMQARIGCVRGLLGLAHPNCEIRKGT
jgi:hypothetical protein